MIYLKNISTILIKSVLTRNALTKMNGNRRLYALSLSWFSKLIKLNSNLLNKKNVSSIHNLNYACKQHTSSSKANEPTSDASDLDNNSLTLGKSKRLMRLIYAKVHPDLFTNERIAQVAFFFILFL